MSSIVILDSDLKRGMDLAYMLRAVSGRRFSSEPIQGFLARWPRATAILVDDDGKNIVDVVDAMLAAEQPRPIFAYKVAPSVSDVTAAANAGVYDYFALNEEYDCIIARIEQGLQPGLGKSENVIRSHKAANLLARLTAREREILSLIALGLSSKDIASELGISERTVEVHRYNLTASLDVANTTLAVRIWTEATFRV